jgi:hypothetical protein
LPSVTNLPTLKVWQKNWKHYAAAEEENER